MFRYFLRPHRFSTYTSETQACDLCNRERSGYRGPFHGRVRVEFVCEDCLVAGKLNEIGAYTNEGNAISLREQLKKRYPEYGETLIRGIVRKRTEELYHCTPRIVTWQDYIWPAHCGDYCLFVKGVGKPDLNELAPDGDGKSFFGEHLHESHRSTTRVEDVWEGIRPDSPKDNSVAYSTGVYVFQCLYCQEYVILWDCD